MKSRRRGSLVVDIHCHYLDTEAAARVAGRHPAEFDNLARFTNQATREVNARQIRDRMPKLTSIERRLKDMDAMGVDIQAIAPAPHQTYYGCEPGEGAELARIINERLADIAARWPERFVALGTIPLQDAGLAVRELTYCMKTLGMRGVEINPNVRGAELTDPKLGLEKFFAKAQALDALIFMHPIGYTQGERLTNHYFNNVIGNPLDTTVAASHLIFDGVMERHPKLKIVLPHAGGFLAHYWARMDHAWKARPDCRTVIRRKPSSYLEKFYFDTITFSQEMLANMVRRYGADHVLLGTDYPFDMGMERPVEFIGSTPGLSAADRKAMMGLNAARLLKIDYNKSTRRRTR